MNQENENLTAEQSLDLIASMIRQAKGNVQKNSFYFILWGWTIAVCNLGLFIMVTFTDISNPFWIWLLTIPAAFISMWHGRQEERESTITHHLDTINKWLWMSYAVICFTIVMFGFKINYQLSPVILCMSAIPTFMSGIILKFRPLLISGVCFWICGAISFILPMNFQFLIASVAIATGYLVPGYLLKARKG